MKVLGIFLLIFGIKKVVLLMQIDKEKFQDSLPFLSYDIANICGTLIGDITFDCIVFIVCGLFLICL